jgi:hypothetical protein
MIDLRIVRELVGRCQNMAKKPLGSISSKLRYTRARLAYKFLLDKSIKTNFIGCDPI